MASTAITSATIMLGKFIFFTAFVYASVAITAPSRVLFFPVRISAEDEVKGCNN